ncbi:DNA-binding protein [Pseudomonas typographi]|uniref:KfrA N-terminal DNA-binding domain-containing protein n=1 Tax=Pseudomonas typographi TaxID=2715964 RepID=A0ABR7YX43_9PSED|nr:DNA-binding protein [Pseudomonas typographi]MBD1551206.1 hypothetical protein [Pseudomonas typographi]MBD1586300.1 hypothetical protein [Pseudomonas typographi]MBD1597772.1 hypothetical protein [Pseudomonas typographi]
MARGGINQDSVQQARDAILARGEHPSIDAVRIELGNTGSKTTIHRYLRALEATEGSLSAGAGSISDELTALVGQLAQRLLGEAQARIDELQAQHQGERDEWARQAGDYQAALEQARQQLQVTTQALASETEARETAQASLQAEQTRNAGLGQANAGLQMRVDDKQAQVASLEEKHRHARDALEHYRTAAKEQREQELRRHELQVQQAQAHALQLQQSLVVCQGELSRVERERERLLARCEQSEQALVGAQHAAAEQAHALAGLQARTAQAEGARGVLLEQLAEFKAERVALEQLLQGSHQALAQAREALAVANANNARLAALEAAR